jgi:SHS2 domain-containing protein
VNSSIEFIPHTADVRLKVCEETLPGLFAKCLEGMNELLKPGFCTGSINVEVKDEVDLKARDTTILLIDFLSEVLTLSYVNKTVYCEFSISQMSDHELRGNVSGKKADGFDTDIKAVTYHEADIRLNDRGEFETIVVFDI